MCGIVGILGAEGVAEEVVDALKRLEYRGYDSAGVASLVNGKIERRRAEGKLAKLAAHLRADPLPGAVAIGHTRWATHGAPTTTNAHPHIYGDVAIVHNGIIENFQELRAELAAKGHQFESDTDTEIVAHLVHAAMADGKSPRAAAAATFKRLEGAFALALIFAGEPDLMIGARKGSPLAVGFGEGEMYLGSDALALSPFTRRIAYLEEGDWVVLTRAGAEFFDEADKPVDRAITLSNVTAALIDKGNHRHFMAKEIYEQPDAVSHTLATYISAQRDSITLPGLDIDLAAISKLTIVACGTAYYAGCVAKYWFEQLARLPVEVDIASEFRYREAAMPEGGMALFISQSGETADTLAALRYSREQKQHIASVVNVAESSIARESDLIFPTHAGPEIGVASTKAFTCQLSALAALAIAFARARGKIDAEKEAHLIRTLTELPRLINKALDQNRQFEQISHDLAKARDVLYLGRGANYPLALEGALKLKEISYIHAEGYAAGEMKHGPIALIDEEVPVVVIAPSDNLFDKTTSNMQEVAARGGRIILFSDAAGVNKVGHYADQCVTMPDIDPFISPIVYAVPVQLLAYHTAVFKGTDVDQPRNLAKSVTVE
ncbi:MAG TPA: glutamine--fructose-6-phosphate transaminase (isomerizing) [Alphaproteobacteria bacterium]|jgi:glucosamine--fructose-6-phosphate aminotransferase (isomerizing)|nr:glutamine--fructose-6-phosphate transaminase (isomerizing) [Alphaproteobacteria bacterium]HBF97873.1 glutamine--fructose-6-phosphate transaminase (isomerizing) [Alphaproteobacteria bacterium]HCO91540.1 glutamine--fructose-6-phosphate transaminase (isomerizing) [Alphaproteobacteria bacterium]